MNVYFFPNDFFWLFVNFITSHWHFCLWYLTITRLELNREGSYIQRNSIALCNTSNWYIDFPKPTSMYCWRIHLSSKLITCLPGIQVLLRPPLKDVRLFCWPRIRIILTSEDASHPVQGRLNWWRLRSQWPQRGLAIVGKGIPSFLEKLEKFQCFSLFADLLSWCVS